MKEANVQQRQIMEESRSPLPKEVPTQWLDAVRRFHDATERLRDEYKALRRQVKSLTRDLREANSKLRENLREKERLKSYLENILEGLNVGVMVADLEGSITLMNRAAGVLLGDPRKKDLGKPLDEFLGRILEEKDVRRLLLPLKKGRKVSIERGIGIREPEALRVVLTCESLKDPSGTPIGVLLTAEDITELRSMQEEMARNQRLAAMGEMAASIAHEVRNPLGSIELFSSLMAEEEEPSERMKTLAQIRAAIQSVDHILSNLLTFSRPLIPRTRAVSVRGLFTSCRELIEPLAKQKGVRLESKVALDCPDIQADEDLLKQALLNVLLNAFQATPKGGRVEMRAESSQSKVDILMEGSMDGQEHWLDLVVEDTGEGIHPNVLPRVFDPFFTTRQGGTGLGLAIVHNIAKAHGGGVRIHSQPGKGTIVRIRIPDRSRKCHSGGREA
jgi:PAS domain S-box-containing protein